MSTATSLSTTFSPSDPPHSDPHRSLLSVAPKVGVSDVSTHSVVTGSSLNYFSIDSPASTGATTAGPKLDISIVVNEVKQSSSRGQVYYSESDHAWHDGSLNDASHPNAAWYDGDLRDTVPHGTGLFRRQKKAYVFSAEFDNGVLVDTGAVGCCGRRGTDGRAPEKMRGILCCWRWFCETRGKPFCCSND